MSEIHWRELREQGRERAVLARHGKSFHLASRLLGAAETRRAARLYAFCRYVDDVADESADTTAARHRLTAIEADLRRGESSDPRVADFLALARECDLDLTPARELLRGVRGDLDTVAIRDNDELRRYCYRVAGTVGLMMCDVLGVSDPRARPFAVDLGIALQLTNIARDVAEDARAGRRYLPASRIGAVAPARLAEPSPELRERLRACVAELLARAEGYYRSGEAGMAFIPARSRLAILVAARVYRAIGLKLVRREFACWRGRVVVSLPGKLWQVVRALWDHGRRGGHWRLPGSHDARLHRGLSDLPGTDPES